jgi:hypothetical protein
MSAPAPRPRSGAGEPGDVLQVLSFFHYALGAMMAMAALVPALWLLVGRELEPGAAELVRTEGAVLSGRVTEILLGLAVAVGLLLGAAIAWGGRSMARRRNWPLCMTTAALSCLLFPIGTLLGGITLAFLLKPELRALFRGQTPGSAENPAD